MRTTLNLDDDVLRAVKEIARLRGSTAGQILSELARASLAVPAPSEPTRNGVPLLEGVVGEGVVTADHVADLLDEA